MVLAFFIIFTALCVGRGTTLPGFLQIAAVGALLSLLLGLAARKLFNYKWVNERTVYLLTPLFAAYGCVLAFEVLKANVKVFFRIFSPKQPQGAVIRFKSGLRSRLANMLLANAITLTPGTITMHTNGDEFSVHCLEASYGEGIESSVLARLVRKIDGVIAASGASFEGKPKRD